MAKRTNIYKSETAKLDKIKAFLEEEHSQDETSAMFKTLVFEYSELLDQTRLITRISDRLQKKLNVAYDKLEDKNEELNSKNDILRKTINDLVEARMGKKAATIVLIVAVILFLASEAFLEPWVERYSIEHFENGAFYISLGIKALIAISIKPIESLIERRLISSARKKTLEDPILEVAKK